MSCPVCFQVDANATTSGVQAAVVVLVTVTAFVVSGVGWFVSKWMRRSGGW